MKVFIKLCPLEQFRIKLNRDNLENEMSISKIDNIIKICLLIKCNLLYIHSIIRVIHSECQ